MNGICNAPAIVCAPKYSPARGTRGRTGYILLEVLVGMTIFAIAGGVLIRSLMNAFDATRILRDTTKALYLTKVMLNDLELRYNRRAEVRLGEFEGNYPYPGTQKFRWHARIESDTKKDAYVITVRTTWDDEDRSPRRRRGRWRGEETGGVTLKSMVMTARYNENLILGFGGKPQVDRRGGSRNERGRGKR